MTLQIAKTDQPIGPPVSLSRFGSLVDSPAVERWLRKKAPRTKYGYLWRWTKLETVIKAKTGAKTPDEFVIWAKGREGTEVQDVLEQISTTQSDEMMNLAVMRSLLRKHGYNALPKMEVSMTSSEFHPGYKREEIQNLLQYLPKPIHKLYILFGKDSGLRRQDLLSLRYRHVKMDLEAEKEFVYLELEPIYYKRKKSSGITFIGPNTVTLLQQIILEDSIPSKKLVYRKTERGSTRRVEVPAEPMFKHLPDGKIDPESPIFPFKASALWEALDLAREKANLDPKIQVSHGLRKFFEQALDKVGMDHHKKLQLEGHSLGIRKAYTDIDPEPLRELYQQAYPYLDLSEEAAADRRVRELEKTITRLEGEKDSFDEGLLIEMGRLRKRVEELEKQNP